MKKAALAGLLLGAALLLLLGCSRGEDSFAPVHYAADAAQIARVRVEVRDRRVEVAASPDGQIHIDAMESEREPYAFSVSEDQTLTVTVADRRDWTEYIGAKPSAEVRRLSLLLPDSYLRALDLSTTNADIVVSALPAVGEVTLAANGGNLLFERLSAEDALALTAKNGDIRGVLAGGYADYAVDCEVKKGESNLPAHARSGGKALTVRCNNGNVSVAFEDD